MSVNRDEFSRQLEAVTESQSRVAEAVEALHARLDDLARLVQGVAESSTRLKLMAGNAKQRDAEAARRLAAIEARLDRLDPPGDDASPIRSPRGS